MCRSTKRLKGFSTCFRQWRADSHCRYLHGYALEFVITFEGDLDHRNWVADFGCFGRTGVKDYLKHMFDHTLVVADDDPSLEYFKTLNEQDLVKLRIFENVGCEAFADNVFVMVDDIIHEETEGRVRVLSVECIETPDNSAIRHEDENDE